MPELTIILPVSEPGNLHEPPHVLAQFVDMVTAKSFADDESQKQISTHLATCIYCQTMLGSYLVALSKYNKAHNIPVDDVEKLLGQLKDIIHETIKDDIPAYVDALMEQNEKKANQHYPLFAEHLQSCEDCKREVADLHSLLQQLEASW